MAKILALAGGVGGAKLVRGLASVLPPKDLIVVVNTGDDFSYLGLSISPDLDTVMYTLAGINNTETGWGVAGDTWHFMKRLSVQGRETWFKIGDRDLETHLQRTRELKNGNSLGSITKMLCANLDIQHSIIPMTNDHAPTFVNTALGSMSFHDYFIRQSCEPAVIKITHSEELHASPNPELIEALEAKDLKAIIICPSNPLLSIAPILSLPGIRERLKRRAVPALAVSPLIGGKAIKGPAAKIMRELGMHGGNRGIMEYYDNLIDVLIIDHRDVLEEADIKISTLITNTLMQSPSDSNLLALCILKYIHEHYHTS